MHRWGGGWSGLDVEAWRYRFYVGVAALACLAESGVAVRDALHPGPLSPLGWESSFGALFCAALLAALLSRRVPLRALDLLVTVSVSVALSIELIQSFQQPGAPEPRLYFIGLFVVLSVVTNVPLRPALLWVGGILAAFAGLVLTRPGPVDATLLIEMLVVVLLVLHLAVFGRQMTSVRVEGQQYRALALTDPLTGLDNRRAMYEHLTRALLALPAGRPFAVVLLDLDHFKSINDRFGHDVGDQVLQRAAQLLQSGTRSGDRVARWGGEEFLVLLLGVSESQAEQVTARFRQAMREGQPGGVPAFTASFGVALARPGDSVSSLLQRADLLMYRAKALGRDRWQLDTPALP